MGLDLGFHWIWAYCLDIYTRNGVILVCVTVSVCECVWTRKPLTLNTPMVEITSSRHVLVSSRLIYPMIILLGHSILSYRHLGSETRYQSLLIWEEPLLARLNGPSNVGLSNSKKGVVPLFRYITANGPSMQGRPSPLRQWCISPLFQISSLFLTKFSDSAENFPNFTFSPNIFRFSSAKICDDLFLVIHHKFRNPPIFPVSIHFPLFWEIFLSPYFCKISPYFAKFPSDFVKVTCLHTLRVFSHYFYHDAFMHHTMHVLNAPASKARLRNAAWAIFGPPGICKWEDLSLSKREDHNKRPQWFLFQILCAFQNSLL